MHQCINELHSLRLTTLAPIPAAREVSASQQPFAFCGHSLKTLLDTDHLAPEFTQQGRTLVCSIELITHGTPLRTRCNVYETMSHSLRLVFLADHHLVFDPLPFELLLDRAVGIGACEADDPLLQLTLCSWLWLHVAHIHPRAEAEISSL